MGTRDQALPKHHSGDDPEGLRRLALCLPAGALLIGFVLPGHRLSAKLLPSLAVLLPGGAAVLARLGRRRAGLASDGRAAAPATVTLVVPARNEAPVIARLVADVAAARSDPMALLIVDDASSDGTGDIAAAAIARHRLGDIASVVRLGTPTGSKAGALAAACLRPGVVVVLDADARLIPAFVDRVRGASAAEPVAQARRRMLRPAGNGPGSWFARGLALVQDGEQAVDDRIARARLALGGAAEFRGDGMCVQTSALAELGGWPREALCEDLELSSRWYLARGRGVARPDDIEVWEQPVLTLGSLHAQRLRWAEGSVRRDLRVVLPALRDSDVPLRRRIEVSTYASQALLPWLVVGLAMRAGTRRRGWRGDLGRDPGRRDHDAGRAAVRGLVALGAGYGASAIVLAWSALDGGLPAPAAAGSGSSARGFAPAPRLLRALGVAAFTAHWPLVLLEAWLRVALRPGVPEFVPTGHMPPDAFSDPEPLQLPPT